MAANTCPAKFSDEMSASESVCLYVVSAISEDNVTVGGVGSGAAESSNVYGPLMLVS